MASSPSPFSNTGKVQLLPTQATLLFTQPVNNIANSTQNGTIIQQPTSIVRLNQTQSQYTPQTVWTNNTAQLSPKLQYSPTIKHEPSTPGQSSILPTKLVAQSVVRQTVTAPQTPKFTDQQIYDFVAKCRTFLTTLLKLAEKQAPEKLPMVRNCIQDLLDGTIDPESFTQRLHTLYKSQPHTSLVPFFKLALPHMRQMVKNTFGRPITIELLEKLNLPSSKTTTTTTSTPTTTTSRVVVNPSLLTQQSSSGVQQPLLYTTVQPQQKINLLQQTPQTLIGTTASLLGQQQHQQQQARAQISITGIRPIVATVSPSSNTNLLTGQQQIQPVTQTIIQPSDSILQRAFISSSGNLQQPQIITVNHQQLRNDFLTNQHGTLTNLSLQQPQFQIQQKPLIKTEEDASDDILGTTTSGNIDDRHTRHITHDKRLLSTMAIRRRLDHLIKTKRWEGGNMIVQDDSVSAIISHATEERLKNLIEQIKSISQVRANISAQNQMETDDHTTGKRKAEESIQPKLVKRKCRANLQDLVCMMENDKHLKRSTLLVKALDKSSVL